MKIFLPFRLSGINFLKDILKDACSGPLTLIFLKISHQTFVRLNSYLYLCTPIRKMGFDLCHKESELNYSLTTTTW
jgi:hypothetical protein